VAENLLKLLLLHQLLLLKPLLLLHQLLLLKLLLLRLPLLLLKPLLHLLPLRLQSTKYRASYSSTKKPAQAGFFISNVPIFR